MVLPKVDVILSDNKVIMLEDRTLHGIFMKLCFVDCEATAKVFFLFRFNDDNCEPAV
jgi:mannitol-specific phosphotransferase system IIBC component